MSISNSSNSSIYAKRFRPIAFISYGLSPISVPSGSLHLVYKPNRSTLDAVPFLTHNIKFLDPFAKSVRCAFSDFSFSFYCVPWTLLLHKLGRFGHPSRILARHSDYSTNRTQFKRLGPKNLPGCDSGVL